MVYVEQDIALTRGEFRSPYDLASRHRRIMMTSFWLGALVLLILGFISSPSIQGLLSYVLVCSAALLPALLWCSGRVHGLPLYPLFGFSFVWSYALPLLIGQRDVSLYLPAEQLSAGLKVTLFLFTGTVVWWLITTSRPVRPRSYYELSHENSSKLLLFVILSAVFYQMAGNANWLAYIPGALVSLLRSLSLGLSIIAVFVLSYSIGRRSLRSSEKKIFIVLLALYLFATAAGLLLSFAAIIWAVAIVGYVVGKRVLPWRVITLAIAMLTILHLGKVEMRHQYWAHSQRSSFEEHSSNLYPWEYPRWYSEWITYGVRKIFITPEEEFQVAEEATHSEFFSLVDRASLFHILLKFQAETPSNVPFLYGATYKIIPPLLIPRFLYPNKPISHEGSIMLAVHYGYQTRHSAGSTRIGIGMLAESFANFGFVGLILIGSLLAALFGAVTRWSMYTPILSGRAMFAIVLMSMSLQRELTAAVFCTTLFQTGVAVLVLVFFTMQKRTLSS